MYLKTDQANDVICSLEQVVRSIEAASSDPLNWKWAILAMHSALQGAMVCHLTGTAEVGALDDKSIEAAHDYHERDRKGLIKRVSCGTDEFGLAIYKPATKIDRPPQEKLANATTLIKRLRNKDKRVEQAGGIVEVTDKEFSDFKALDSLRNQFTHFPPTSWLIELAGMKNIVRSALTIIQKIQADDWPFRHLTRDDRKRLTSTLSKLHTALAK